MIILFVRIAAKFLRFLVVVVVGVLYLCLALFVRLERTYTFALFSHSEL